MEPGNVNLNDFVASLSQEVARLADVAKTGSIRGRETVHILSDSKEVDFSGDSKPRDVVSKVADLSVGWLKGQEISNAPSSNFKERCSTLSAEEIENRKAAYDVLLEYFETTGQVSSLYKRCEGILREQKEFLSHLPGLEELIRPQEILPFVVSPQVEISPRELRELNDDFDYLKEIHLETANEILTKEDLDGLNPRTEARYYELWKEKEMVSRLKEKLLPHLSNEQAQELTILTDAIDRIDDGSFLKDYKTFEDLKNDLNNVISSESSDEVEMSLRELMKNRTNLMGAMNQHPLENVLWRLSSPKLQLCFYCLAKYQDEIKQLAERMNQNSIYDSQMNPEDLQMLSELAEQAAPLKKHFRLESPPIVPSLCEMLSLPEAEEFQRKALEIFQFANGDSELLTTAQELLWRSALGFVQNGSSIRADECFSFAAKNFPQAIDLGLDDLEGRLNADPQNGIFLSGFGSSYNKEQSVHMTKCQIDDKAVVAMDFELNGHALLGLKTCLETLDLENSTQLMDRLPPGFCSGIEIGEREAHQYYDYIDGRFNTETPGYKLPGTRQIVFEFKGIGKVIIGNCPGVKCISNMVFVEAVPQEPIEKTLSNIQTMLAALGAPPVVVQSRKEDLQRKALFHVFRAFYPREAALLERDGKSFQLSPEALRQQILQFKPEMRELFNTHLNADLLPLKVVETVQGKQTTWIDMSSGMRQRGALGLMAGMDGSVPMRARLLSRMLRPTAKGGTGMVSSQMRFMKGIIAIGQSSYSDHKDGGAAGVFTRLITKEIAQSKEIDEMAFHGTIQFLINLEAVNKPNSYGFEQDCFGTRASGNYFSRLNLLELTEVLQRPSQKLFGKPAELKKYGTANEVVIRDSISPELIQGIVVRREEDKRAIINQFLSDGILDDREGVLYLGEIPVMDYIKVSSQFTEEMWHV